MVKDRQLDAVDRQQASDDLAEAPEAGDDHVVLVVFDRVVGSRLAVVETGGDQLVVDDQQQRRGHHRQGDDHDQDRGHVGRQHPRRLRRAEHDKGELAALGKQKGKQRALAARDAKELGQAVQHQRFQDQEGANDA